MKILFINQYFTPEPGAGTARVYFHAKYFTKLGHNVTVICGIPNYPNGKIFKGYRNLLWMKESFEGITVYRTLVYPSKYTSNLRRFLNYLVFTLSSFITGLFIETPDIIISSSPPPSSGVTSLFLSYVKGKPLIFEVRDVWPGAALALGYLKNRVFLHLKLFFLKKIY